MSIAQTKEFNDMEVKILKVVGSCTTLYHYHGAMRYVNSAKYYLLKFAKTREDVNFIDNFINRNRGFIGGIIWEKTGRMIFSS